MKSRKFRSQLSQKSLISSDSAKRRHRTVIKQIFTSMERRLSFPLVLFLEGYVIEDIAKILETSEREVKECLKEGWSLVDFSALSKTCQVSYPILKTLKTWLATPRNFHIAQLN